MRFDINNFIKFFISLPCKCRRFYQQQFPDDTPISDNLLADYVINEDNEDTEVDEDTKDNINNWNVFQAGGLYVADFGMKATSASDNCSLGYYGRTAEWHSPYINLYDVIKQRGPGRYIVTFWLFADEVTADDMKARVIIRGNKNSFIKKHGSNYYAPIGRQYSAKTTDENGRIWYKMSGAFDVSASDISAPSGAFNLMFDKLPVAGDGYVFIDDIKLYQVDNFIKKSDSFPKYAYYIVNKESGQYLTATNTTGTFSYITQKRKYNDTQSTSLRNLQLWYIHSGEEGVWFETAAESNYCLQITDPDTEYYGSGSNITVNPKHENLVSSQEFKLKISDDGISYRIVPLTDDEYFSLKIRSNIYDEDEDIFLGASMPVATNSRDESDTWYLIPDTYSYDNSVVYATTNFDNYNANTFPNMCRNDFYDCTNFVSQCIYVSGKKTGGTWYVNKLNDSNPMPANTTQLNNSWSLSDPSPWISAEQFYNYWSNNAINTYTFEVDSIIENPSILSNNPNIGVGDVISYLKYNLFLQSEGAHTAIITGSGSVKINQTTFSCYTISQHSTSRCNFSLWRSVKNYKENNSTFNRVIVYDMG